MTQIKKSLSLGSKVNEIVSVTDFGAVGDWDGATGTDDTAVIQAAINYAAATATVRKLYVPNGRYRIAGNLYIYGDFDIVGESREKAEWALDLATGTGENGNKYHIAVGVASYGGEGNPWNGEFRNLYFKATANAVFERAFFVLSSRRGRFEHCRWDMSLMDSGTGSPALAGPIESGNNANWASGGVIVRNIFKITNCIADCGHEYHGSEGLGLEGWDYAEISNCSVTGPSDDVVALHTCTTAVIRNNSLTSITGRILIDQCKNYWVQNNETTRIPDPTTGTWYSSNFIETTMASSGTDKNANEIGFIHDNIMHAPDGAITSYWMRLKNCQKFLSVRGNVFDCESTSSQSVTAISIEATTPEVGASWVGQPDNPDYTNGGTVRVRKVSVEGNKDSGSLRSGTFQTTGSTSDFLDSFTIRDNDLEDYNCAIPQAVFDASNKADTTDGIKSISAKLCVGAYRIPYTFTGVDNTYLTGSPLTATPVYGTYRVNEAARIMGGEVSITTTGTAGNVLTTRIKVNGSQVKEFNLSAASSTFISSSFTGNSGLTVVEGDLITVEMYTGSGQLVALQGGVNLIVQPA